MKLPSIMFITQNPIKLVENCNTIAATPLEILKSVLTNYSPFKSKLVNNNDTEYIPISQYLYDDISHLKEINENKYKYFMTLYNFMIDSHGQEFIDLIFVKDQNQIIQSVNNALTFISDKVYKTDLMLLIFKSSKETIESYSSIPNLIYSAIQQNFNIKDQREIDDSIMITIERRRNDNVNNAN